MQLSKDKFKDILNGILAITGGSIESYYVLLYFLNKKDYVQFQKALEDMPAIIKNQKVGALHFAKDPTCVGAIEFFNVMVFVSNAAISEGFPDSPAPSEQRIVLDVGQP